MPSLSQSIARPVQGNRLILLLILLYVPRGFSLAFRGRRLSSRRVFHKGKDRPEIRLRSQASFSPEIPVFPFP